MLGPGGLEFYDWVPTKPDEVEDEEIPRLVFERIQTKLNPHTIVAIETPVLGRSVNTAFRQGILLGGLVALIRGTSTRSCVFIHPLQTKAAVGARVHKAKILAHKVDPKEEVVRLVTARFPELAQLSPKSRREAICDAVAVALAGEILR